MTLRVCWHEAGHALIGRDQGRRLEFAAVSPDGGLVKWLEPPTGDRTPQALEADLVMALAGKAAEAYAPKSPDALAAADQNGGDIFNGLAATTEHNIAALPSDAEAIPALPRGTRRHGGREGGDARGRARRQEALHRRARDSGGRPVPARCSHRRRPGGDPCLALTPAPGIASTTGSRPWATGGRYDAAPS